MCGQIWSGTFATYGYTCDYGYICMAISLWELQSDLGLKDVACSTEGVTWSSVNYLRKIKREYLCDLLHSEINENAFVYIFFFSFELGVSLFFSSVCFLVF